MADSGNTDISIHFETSSDKPRVFRMTKSLISDALVRNQGRVNFSLGENLSDLSALEGASGLVTSNDVLRDRRFPLNRLMEIAPRLQWIHIIGAGIEPLLPFDWLPDHVSLTNNSGVHVEKMRESAAMLLLMLNAKFPAIASNQRQAKWKQIFTPAIQGRSVLIIGVGDMGGAVADAARSLRMHVIGVRRSDSPHASVHRMHQFEDLDTLLPLADFVVLAAPLTKETTGLLNKRRLGLLKPGAGFINIGRAGSVDHDALAAALQSGSLSGAILDVFDPEPLPQSSPLWTTENLLVVPHVTSDDEDRYLPKTFDLVFENARRLVTKEPLLNRVDTARGY
jgi:phosphoglycerate dehydrogenase-like enzyme